MTLVQDVKQQILFIKRSTRELNALQCTSLKVSWWNDSCLWKLVETTIETYACQETVSKLSLKLYDSCLESILQSLLLSPIFHPGFQKLSASNPSILSQVWCVALLWSLNSLSHLSQWGPCCQAFPLKMFLKLLLFHTHFFPGEINSLLLSSISSKSCEDPYNEECPH